MRMLIGSGLAAVLLIAAPDARAAEVLATFTVPVSLHSVNQQVDQVKIACWLNQKDPVTGNIGQYGVFNPGPWINGESDNGNSVARLVKPDANGNFEGTLTLTLHKNVEPGILISAQCNMALMIGNNAYTVQPATNAKASIAVKAAPGTTYKDQVTKPL